MKRVLAGRVRTEGKRGGTELKTRNAWRLQGKSSGDQGDGAIEKEMIRWIAIIENSDTSKKPAGRLPSGPSELFNFTRALFAIALAGESFFGAALFPWFQVERMPFYFFNDIFLLYFTFEPSKSTFECLAILEMDFCQLKIHHLPELLV